MLGYRFGADASGPRWRHVRTEMEYFYRATAYDQTVAVPGLGAGSGSVTADKLNQARISDLAMVLYRQDQSPRLDFWGSDVRSHTT